METELKQNLSALSAEFASSRDIGVTAVWLMALNDRAFSARLKDPEKTITVRTYDRATQWFSDNWPDGAEWPASIARPAPSTVAA